MRDDVKILLESLLELYGTKHILLQNLHKDIATKLYYCKSGDYSRLSDSIESDHETFTEIDLLDFNISRIRTELCRVMGIKASSLIPILSMGIHPLFRRFLTRVDDVASELRGYTSDHDELIKEMESHKEEINKARKSLLSLIKIAGRCCHHTDTSTPR